MNEHKFKRAEVALGEAFRRQTVPPPPDEWFDGVMAAVRSEAVPEPARFPAEVRIAWRMAWAAAAAAVIAVAVGFSTMPSAAQLAWQFEEGGAISAWIVKVENDQP